MADPVLKLAPEQKAESLVRQDPRRSWLHRKRRAILLIVVPLLAAITGAAFYLSGGRYVSTDNAYIGAQKVLITPDISGKISRVVVREGQRVAPGDALFEIDPVPFRLAVQQSQSRLAGVRTDFANLKSNLAATRNLIDLAKTTVDIRQRDLDRKSTLVQNRSGSQADVDASMAALVAAQNQLAQLRQSEAELGNQLKNDPDLPIEEYPSFMQAKAALDQAERDLAHTIARAPLAGTATQVDNVQLGRYVSAGTPVLSVVDDRAPWVDANPKETDVTFLHPGQPVTVDVDAFPGRTFHGTVAALSPGTGAQFSILPPQNASGNWVKVVQRVPVRIVFNAGEDTENLRAGMSAVVNIDTGRSRSLGKLIGALFGAVPPTASATPRP